MHSPARYAAAMGASDRLRAAREAAGFETATAAADAMGVPAPTYLAHENGSRGFPASRARSYASTFGTSAEWLLYGGAPEPPRGRKRRQPQIKLVGYVAAGSEAHYYALADDPNEWVDAPDDATDKTVAAEIRGTSLGPAFDRWLVYYDDVRSPVTADLHGQLCVVGTGDQVLVKIIRPAGAPNRFHLISNGTEEPLFDREVTWAARVKSMKPRR